MLNSRCKFVQLAHHVMRNYALRRIRDSFAENKHLTDPAKINQQMLGGQRNLEIIKRQVLVGNLYQTDKLVIEMKK